MVAMLIMNTALALCLDLNASNIADTYVEDYNPTNTYGSQTQMSCATSSFLSTTKHRAFIRFDISDVPESAIIDKAELRVKFYYVQYKRNVDIYEVDSNNWNESINWNSQPLYGNKITSITDLTTGMNTGILYTSDVTDWVNDRLNNDKTEVSFCFRDSSEGASSNNLQIYTRDFSTVSSRPVLNISYVLVGSGVLDSPENNTTFTDYPLLVWLSSTNAIKYKLQIYEDSDLNTSVYDDWVNDLSYQTSLLSNGTYYWRVYGSDGTNDGLPSETRFFNLNIPIPVVDPGTPSNPVYPDLTDDTPIISVDGEYTGDLQNVLFRNLFNINDKIGIPTWSLILLVGIIGVWKRRPELVIFCGLLFMFLLFFGYKLSMVAI